MESAKLVLEYLDSASTDDCMEYPDQDLDEDHRPRVPLMAANVLKWEFGKEDRERTADEAIADDELVRVAKEQDGGDVQTAKA